MENVFEDDDDDENIIAFSFFVGEFVQQMNN